MSTRPPGKRRPSTIFVTSSDGTRAPLSKGLMSQNLMTMGLDPAISYEIARDLQKTLRGEGHDEITSQALVERLASVVEERVSESAAQRWLEWNELKAAQVPLIILIAGATGTGKSTIAAQIAHRFQVSRLTSTDSLREVMRELSVPAMVPQLYQHSYSVPAPPGAREDDAVAGYLAQAILVGIGVRAVVKRTIKERTSVILEGVHLYPDVLDGIDMSSCAVVQATLSVPSAGDHAVHFRIRDAQTGGQRPADEYLLHFSRIRSIHDWLVNESIQRGHEILDTTDLDSSLSNLVARIVAELRRVAKEQPLDELLDAEFLPDS